VVTPGPDSTQGPAVDDGVKVSNELATRSIRNVVQAGVVHGDIHFRSLSERVVPRQLPLQPGAFIGRATELGILDKTMIVRDSKLPVESAGQIVAISAIGGAGGIGKTWLALHWADRNAHRFPDGQLFVDLHGFSPTGEPVEPLAAVRGFLEALGVDPAGISGGLAEHTALYRSKVADKRMLIVLDNAFSIDQVVPLLPGTATCTVLITGRKQFASLIDRFGAQHLQLDILDHDEARTMLTERLGQQRVAAEADAVDELIRLCGRYPLALAIMTRHAHTRPRIPLAELATELRELGLDALDNDDPAASLPAVLSWSLRGLTLEQRTIFALLGVAPGPDIGLFAAANLVDTTPASIRKHLNALGDASLIDRHPHDRYVMHDLIRDYAKGTAHRDLTDDVRSAALRRVMDFYMHTAHVADRLLRQPRESVEAASAPRALHPQPLSDALAAWTWIETEYRCLLAVQAAANGQSNEVYELALILDDFHYRRGHRHERLSMWLTASTAVKDLHDPAVETLAHAFLGDAYAQLDRHDEAIKHLHHALVVAEQHQDEAGQARAHLILSWAWKHRGDPRPAVVHASRALDLARATQNLTQEAYARSEIGWHAARLGDYTKAREHCQTALVMHRSCRDLDGEAHILDSLGYIEHHAGDHHKAVDHYERALVLYRGLGHQWATASTLRQLGYSYLALDLGDLAGAAWREALHLFREQQRDKDATHVLRELDALDRRRRGDEPE
jgi:tetratricopeptide (TPR) repeat protein